MQMFVVGMSSIASLFMSGSGNTSAVGQMRGLYTMFGGTAPNREQIEDTSVAYAECYCVSNGR
jgi:hypothetical protein